MEARTDAALCAAQPLTPMPISPDNRKRYPKDWPEISHRIRFVRGLGQCECTGECGVNHNREWTEKRLELSDFHADRCPARHGELHPITRGKVVLTTAHLPGREIEQCEDGDLKGMCQRCHNRMDAPSRKANASKTRHRRKGQEDLFK